MIGTNGLIEFTKAIRVYSDLYNIKWKGYECSHRFTTTFALIFSLFFLSFSLSASRLALKLGPCCHHHVLSLHAGLVRCLLFPLASSGVARLLLVDVWHRCRVLIQRHELSSNTGRLCLLQHWRSHSLLAFLPAWWGVYHLLLLEKELIDSSSSFIGHLHTARHTMHRIILVNRSFSLVDEFVVANDTHITRHGTNLAHIVELCWGIWRTYTADSLIRAHRIVPYNRLIW